MLLTIVIEKSLGNQHVHQAAQAARQHNLSWRIVLALCPSAQVGQ